MNTKKILVNILILILVMPIIYGVGIGLWVEEVQFSPNFNQNFNAFIGNNADQSTRVRLAARGELAEYVTFSQEYLDIGPGGKGFFTFNLKPEVMSGKMGHWRRRDSI